MSASFEEFKRVCKRVCGARGTSACREETCLFIVKLPEWDVDKIKEDIYKEFGLTKEIIDKVNEPYSKCKCYNEVYGKSVCTGTKECDETDCEGNEFKCKFYDYVREKAEKKLLDTEPIVLQDPLENIYEIVVKREKLKNDTILCNIKNIADGHDLEEIIFDEEKIATALQNYKKEKVEVDYFGVAKCPTCGISQWNENDNFCSHCGQHLDWSEKE